MIRFLYGMLQCLFTSTSIIINQANKEQLPSRNGMEVELKFKGIYNFTLKEKRKEIIKLDWEEQVVDTAIG